MDANGPFDPKDAPEWGGDARDIVHLVTSKGYSEWLLPFMIGTLKRWHAELADPSIQRHWKRPDDYLRGGIKVLEALLRLPNDVLGEQNQRNEEERLSLEEAARYEDIAAGGRGPYGEDSMEISPTDPI